MPIQDSTLHEQWCQHRDADAIAELVRRHSAMVYSTCMRALRNASAAEEAAQECFIELFKLPTPIRPSVGGWLHTVAARRAADHLKMEIRRKTREADYAIQAPRITTPAWDDVSAHIDAAIANLVEDSRIPVVLRFLDGKSHPEIARELGLSVATVKRRVNQGVYQIREELRGKGIAVTAVALAAMLEEVPALPLPNAVVAELGKIGISGSAGWTGTTGVAALKSAATIGGILAVKKAAIAAAVIVIAGLVFVQQQYLRSTPSVPPPSSEKPAEPMAAPEPLQAAVVATPPEATLLATTGPSISGVVLDHEGNPIEGATVDMRRIVGDKADPRIYTESAADGSFAFRNVAPSKRVDVMAKKDGMVWMPDQNGMHELTEAGLSDVVVRLCPEATIEGRVVDLSGLPVTNKEVSAASDRNETFLTDSAGQFRMGGLEPGTHGLSVIPKKQYTAATVDAAVTLKPGEKRTGVKIVYWGDDYTVSGRVVNNKGEPLKDVMVQLIGVDGPNPREDYTDEEGKFRLVRIPEGRYSTYINDYVHGSSAWAHVTAGDEDLEFVLASREKVNITGHVVAAETGESITKFQIQVGGDEFGSFRSFESETGEFTWEARNGRITLIARAPGREMKYEDLDLTQGPPDKLVLRLESGEVARGVVVTSAGTPVPGAYLIFSPFPHHLVENATLDEQLKTDWMENHKVARSKEDGTFVIDSLTPKLRVVSAFHSKFGYGSIAVDRKDATRQELRIVVNTGGAIGGTITVGGSPVQYAQVTVVSQGAFDESLGASASDGQGAYRIDGVPEGTWTVAVRLPAGANKSPEGYFEGRRIERKIGVVNGKMTTFDLDFPASAASLEGTVYIEGEPAVRGTVLLDADGAESNQTGIDADGHYRFDEVPQGKVRLIAQASLESFAMRSAIQEVTLTADGTNTSDFQIARGVALQGTVRGLLPEERSILITVFEGALDRAQDDYRAREQALRGQAKAEPGGAYTIEGLTPGTYTLFVNASVLDETGMYISGRDAQVVIEVVGADGDVMELDPVME